MSGVVQYRMVKVLPGAVGSGRAHWIRVEAEAIAKWNDDVWAYCVANEYICAELGRFLRLKVPPHGILRCPTDGKSVFGGWRFEGQPHIFPDLCVKHLPSMCARIVAFDIFIGNPDRHSRNLAADKTAEPKLLHVFDHGAALVGPHLNRGLSWMKNNRAELIVDKCIHGTKKMHCLLPYLESFADFSEAVARIRSIPDWFIKDTCDEGRAYGLSPRESSKASEFLKYRRDHLSEIAERNKDAFARISEWELFV